MERFNDEQSKPLRPETSGFPEETSPRPAQADGGEESKADELRESAADALEGGARTAREWGREAPGGPRTTEWGSLAGERFGEASGYLRRHNVDEITEDLEIWVRQNPVPSLLFAAALGFLAGAALNRS